MLIQPYSLSELRFAYCYRVYLRWRTHKARPLASLATLEQATLEGIADKYGIRILECASNATDVLTMVSLKPEETISACASKLKGQLSKWLREAQGLTQPVEQLANGYFACTVGKSSRAAVEQYLNRQSEHHGYAERTLPPTLVESYELSEADETRIRPQHAMAMAQFHIVLATSWRRGVFGPTEGHAVAEAWRAISRRAALLKVSFLPDHVHLAIRTHPAESPAALVVELMNAAQQVVFEKFAGAVLQAKVERLWQPSAYLGSYGELTSPQMRQYIHNFAGEQDTLNANLHATSSEELEFTDEAAVQQAT